MRVWLSVIIIVLLLSELALGQEQTFRLSGRLDPQPPPGSARLSGSPRVTVSITAGDWEERANVEERADYRFLLHVPRSVVDRKLTLKFIVSEVDGYLQAGYSKTVSRENYQGIRVPYPHRQTLSALYFARANEKLANPAAPSGDLRDAIRLYASAIEFNPSDLRPYLGEAQAWRRLGEPDNETQVYTRLTAHGDLQELSHPAQARLFKEWGDAEFRKNSPEGWQGAEDKFKAALVVPGAHPDDTAVKQGWFDAILRRAEYKDDASFVAKVLESENLRKSWTAFYATVIGRASDQELTAASLTSQVREVKQAFGR